MIYIRMPAHTLAHMHTQHTHTHTYYSLDDVLGRTVAGRMQGHPSFVVSNVHICSVIQEEPHHLRLPINARLHTQQQHTQKKVNTPHDVTHVTHVITSHVTYIYVCTSYMLLITLHIVRHTYVRMHHLEHKRTHTVSKQGSERNSRKATYVRTCTLINPLIVITITWRNTPAHNLHPSQWLLKIRA